MPHDETPTDEGLVPPFTPENVERLRECWRTAPDAEPTPSPVTPLPWARADQDRHFICDPNQNGAFALIGKFYEAQDAEYAVHVANAHPALVTRIAELEAQLAVICDVADFDGYRAAVIEQAKEMLKP